MNRTQKLVLFALCCLAAVLQGWLLLKDPAHNSAIELALLYLGIPGGAAFVLVVGVHGSGQGVAGIVGGILYVLVNGAVYYGITVLIYRWIRRRREAREFLSIR